MNAFGLNTAANNAAFFTWPIKARNVNNVGGIIDADKLFIIILNGAKILQFQLNEQKGRRSVG